MLGRSKVHLPACLALALIGASVASGATLEYECDVFPEEVGFERFPAYDPDRWIEDGWFVQEIELGAGPGGPLGGERDTYHHPLSAYIANPFFIEWKMITDAPNSEVDMHNGGAIVVLVGGPVTYHFNMASGLTRIIRGYPYPTEYFEIEPDVAHVHRLEVYGGDYFEFRIDDIVMDSGTPEDVWPTSDALISWGSRYYQSEHATRWDYLRFGTIPEPGTGLLLLVGMAAVRARNHMHCR